MSKITLIVSFTFVCVTLNLLSHVSQMFPSILIQLNTHDVPLYYDHQNLNSNCKNCSDIKSIYQVLCECNIRGSVSGNSSDVILFKTEKLRIL